MAKIEDLIKNIPDKQLREELGREVGKLKAGKKFGLVFEEHIPEQVQIPSLPVKPGLRVVKRGGKNNEVFKVLAPASAGEFTIAREPDGSAETAPTAELVKAELNWAGTYNSTALHLLCRWQMEKI